MLIDSIVSYCDEEYLKKNCDICSYENHCPHNCEKCLEYIHFPGRAPAPREYDCSNMANYYTCKYSHKYMSEAVYALRQLRDLRDKKYLKVMSIGCGPCTDLFALDFLKKEGVYEFESMEFRGIDPAKKVWSSIHRKIKEYDPNTYTTKFYYRDVIELIDEIIEVKWAPDLIVFQYVFSDMRKHYSAEVIENFITKVAVFVNNIMGNNTYILLNDINLSTKQMGGREYFDDLLNKLENVKKLTRHFDNSNKNTHYHYGDEYKSNLLVLSPQNRLDKYNPYASCSSAQLIIKKVIE